MSQIQPAALSDLVSQASWRSRSLSGSLVVALELVDELGPADADWEELEEDGGKGEAVGRSCWPETSLQVP